GRPPRRARLREVEVERVQQLDGRVRRVHGHIRGHVEERFRVVEDDLDARVHQRVGRLLGRVGGDGEDADDDVLVANDAVEAPVVGDLDVADPATGLVGVDVEDGRDV